MPDTGPIRSLPLKEFYYLRHGETDWNVANRVQGHTDIPLNDKGLAQAEAASKILTAQPIATICASPLSRARKTADFTHTVLGCPLHEIEDLKEVGWGVEEGRIRGPWFEQWLTGDLEIDGAEIYQQFLDRALGGIRAALEHPGPVLIVAHGRVYESVKAALGIDDETYLPNCLPLHHIPPAEPGGAWTVRVLD